MLSIFSRGCQWASDHLAFAACPACQHCRGTDTSSFTAKKGSGASCCCGAVLSGSGSSSSSSQHRSATGLVCQLGDTTTDPTCPRALPAAFHIAEHRASPWSCCLCCAALEFRRPWVSACCLLLGNAYAGNTTRTPSSVLAF